MYLIFFIPSCEIVRSLPSILSFAPLQADCQITVAQADKTDDKQITQSECERETGRRKEDGKGGRKEKWEREVGTTRLKMGGRSGMPTGVTRVPGRLVRAIAHQRELFAPLPVVRVG